MAIVKNRLLVGAFGPTVVAAALHATIAATGDPFPLGFSMGNNGTILRPNAPSCRQPWIPACFCADSLRFGLTACGIDYYDEMDNFAEDRISQVAIGGWYRVARYIIKGSYAYFNALNFYNEQQGFFSMGVKVAGGIQASVEMTGLRAGLTREPEKDATLMYGGASCMAYGKNGAISLSCGRLPIKQAARQGFDEPVSVSGGVYARSEQYGSQGVVGQVSHEKDWTFRFSIGEEYCCSDYFSVCGAVAMNPFAFFFGCTVSYGRSATSLSFANHPQLGWSKGLTLDYARP